VCGPGGQKKSWKGSSQKVPERGNKGVLIRTIEEYTFCEWRGAEPKREGLLGWGLGRLEAMSGCVRAVALLVKQGVYRGKGRTTEHIIKSIPVHTGF